MTATDHLFMPFEGKYTEPKEGSIRLHYLETGSPDGFPVVLLPGWPQTAYAWRRVLPLLAKAGYRTLAFDLPGQGESDYLPAGTPYDANHVAEVIYDALQTLGLREIHLVSHDVGAWIAFSMGTLHPTFVRSLTMVETQLLGISPSPDVSMAPKAFQYFLNGVPELAEMLTRGRERDLLAFLFRTKSGNKQAIGPEDLDEYMRSYGDPARMVAGFNYYRAVPQNMKLHRQAPKLLMPTLALGAENGVGMTFYESMRAHAVDLRGGQLDGYGHYLPEECPEQLSERIISFFQVCSPRMTGAEWR